MTRAESDPTRPSMTDAATSARLIGPDSAVVQDAPVAIYSVDLNGNVLSWNRFAERVFGWSEDEVLGRPLPYIRDDKRQAAAESFASLLDGQPIGGVPHQPLHKEGHQIHALTNVTILPDDEGNALAVVCFSVDVTTQVEATNAIARAEHKWRVLLESTTDAVTLVDRNGVVRQTTGQFTDVLGYPGDSWGGRSGFDLIHPDDQPLAFELFEWILEHPGQALSEVFRTRHSEDHWELIEYTVINKLDDPDVDGIVVTTHNVTDLRLNEALLSDEATVLERIARNAPLAETLAEIVRMVEFHTASRASIVLLEDAGEQECQITADADLAAMLDSSIRSGAPSACTEALRTGDPVLIRDLETHPLTRDSCGRYVEAGLRAGWSFPVAHADEEAMIGTIAIYCSAPREPSSRELEVVDIASHLTAIATEHARAQRQLEHQARHDQLTGLPNRWAIVDRLDAALFNAGQTAGRIGVLLIDLDRFKVVNDSLGHEAGDALLIAFGSRLSSLVEPDGFVGHFGADEFVVVLEELGDVDEVFRIASRLDLALSEPFTISAVPAPGDHEIYLTASIGVALGDAGSNGHQLLQQADTAMFRAKDRGRDRLEVFDSDMQARATEQLRVDRELRVAVERAELRLHYQPKIELSTGQIVGAEALLRWQHPERGLVTPLEFISLAEETGLIVRIGTWVIDEAVRQARAWVDRIPGLDSLSMSVNLSARQLADPGLVTTVSRALDRYNWPASSLTLELTESILIDDADSALAILRQLKALGLRLAIDDFGTGYSSLGYLHRFPFDIVKVDRSFVQPLESDGQGSAVATAVMHMARALGLLTIAEGVEEPEQLAGLRSLGCDWAQGFYFAEALPAAQLATMLAESRRW